MSFLYVKSSDSRLLSRAKELFRDEYNACRELPPGKLIFYDKNKTFHHSDNTNAMVMAGRILYDKMDEEVSKKQFINDIIAENWPLPDKASGFFSGFLTSGDKDYIFNDAVGVYHLYYYLGKDTVIVSFNLFPVYRLLELSVNNASVVLQSISPFIEYGKMTVLEGVYRLMPGEMLLLENYQIKEKKYDITIKERDDKPDDNMAEELVDLINRETGKLYRDKEIILPLSAGIDSRVILMALLANNIPFKAVNYGIPGTIETDLALKLSKKFGFTLEIVDPTPHLFPPKEVTEDIIKKTDSLFVNLWHGILLKKDGDENKFFLLGDMLDILRAKGIKSMKTRKFRTRYYIKKALFGYEHPYTPFSEMGVKQFQEEKIDAFIIKARKVFSHFDFTGKEQEKIIEKIKEDFQVLFKHLEKYHFETLESYEELFSVFTAGRINMGRQLNLLMYKYRAEIPLSNIRILRKVLNISPKYRYADELTTKMFKTESWKKGGKIPTNQNPFFAYNAPFYMMMSGWFLRSKTDYFLTKLSVLTKGKWKKKRLFPTYDFKKSYEFPGADERFKTYFQNGNGYDFTFLTDLFEQRKTGEKWPLSPIDMMPFVQSAFWLNRTSRRKKKSK